MAVTGSAASGADREELLRMSAEKVAAFYESWNAMLVAAWAANMRLLLSASIGSAPWVAAHRRAARAHVRRTGLDILEAGIGPVHRRVVANAKRLRSVR